MILPIFATVIIMAGLTDAQVPEGKPLQLGEFMSIADTAITKGIEPDDLLTFAEIESGRRTGRDRPGEGAKGVFQILPSTAAEGGFDPTNVLSAAQYTASQMKFNQAALEKLGLPNGLAEQFLAHNMGTKGAAEILTTAFTDDGKLSAPRLKNMRNNLNRSDLEKFDALESDREKAKFFVDATKAKVKNARNTILSERGEEIEE